jgi:hypothetical protein
MPTAEELKARFENRLRPGPTDERLAASLGLAAAMPERLPMGEGSGAPEVVQRPGEPAGANGTDPEAKTAPDKAARTNGKTRRQGVRLVKPDDVAAPPASDADDPAGQRGSGGANLDTVAELFPPPPLLAAAGPEPVKVGFPVPVELIRDVTRLKVDLSRQLGRRLSNHEIGAAAAGLLPGEPGQAAELVRGHATRLGLSETSGVGPRRRLVADIPSEAATGLEDLVLAVDATENVRVTKSQLWALAHVLLLERAGR